MINQKVKNDYFQDMLLEVLNWGVKPNFVTGDSWYSCVSNLKMIINHQLGFALKSNRLVSIEKKYIFTDSKFGYSKRRFGGVVT